MADEIIEELWKIKDSIAHEYGSDLDSFIAHLKAQEQSAQKLSDGQKVVNLRPKNILPITIETGTFATWNRREAGTRWTLLTGHGFREYRQRVDFQKTFRTPPDIMIGLSMFDVRSGTNDRVNVKAENITQIGFDVVFETWADTQVYGLGANWIAIGL